MKARPSAVLAACVWIGASGLAAAQGSSAAASKPRPWSRVSFFTNSSRTDIDGGIHTTFNELSTTFSYQLPDLDDSGAEYGADLRYASYAPGTRPDRVSIYEGFVGARLAGGTVRFRLGHVWLTDLGSLGSLAGGVFEVRQARATPDGARFRFGAFGGLEPNVLDAGYASNVRKMGGYIAYDGKDTRRHSIGYAMIRNGRLTERSVVTTSNFLPVRRKVFVYQIAEYNLEPPAQMGRRGLAYFFTNARVNPHDRLEVQATYNRGRSIDARGLGEDVLNGRAVTPQAADGFLYQSIGGRVTGEVLPRVRLYAGYSQDKNNRDAEPTGRTIVGGYASNVGGSGIDLSGSDSLMHRPNGSYHARYISAGHQIGRSVYVTGDYSTSLSVVRFSRSDGITIETRPHATRISGTATINMRRAVSLLATVERTREDDSRDLRILTGITYRVR